MVKVTHKPNVQQIGKCCLKYVFKKGFFADIKKCVRRDFNDREMFKTQKEKSKIHKSMFSVYDLFNNKDI